MDVDQTMEKIRSLKSKLRSVILTTNQRASFMSSILNKTFSSLKIHLLIVVDLWDAPIHYLPREIKKLLKLRYLSLRNTKVVKLTSFIGHLGELQTLDLKHSQIHKLPSEVNKLHKLRHLLAYIYIFDLNYSHYAWKPIGVKMPQGTLEKLVELQKLVFIDVVEDSRLIEELKQLSQLRRLGIMGLKREDGNNLCAIIQHMEFLESLSVYSKTKNEELDLQYFESWSHVKLKRLYLNGPMMAFPSWIFKLKLLTKIRLRWSSLDIDPLEIFESFPSLVEFQLLAAYRGKNLKIRNNGFKKLKVLHLYDLHPLESLIIEKGALPLLRQMEIGDCPNLQVPLGIEYIPRLQILSFLNMPPAFVCSLKPDGTYYSVVKYVPHIHFQNWNHHTASWGP